MTASPSFPRRFSLVFATMALLLGTLAPTLASADTKLFVVVSQNGEIWRIDPTTGAQLSSFPVVQPQLPASRPGLAFNGTDLFYTDENHSVIQVYSQTGTLVRSFAKPPGVEPGTGLGVSTTSLFLIDLEGVITAVDPLTGAVQSTFQIPGSSGGLTFAGSRNSIFASLDNAIEEFSPSGTLLNTLPVNDFFSGLGFSSSSNTLFAVRTGQLFAFNPDSGALLAGYPVDIVDPSTGIRVPKTGGLASDEIASVCGDGQVNAPGETCDPPGSTLPNGAICSASCTYCGDGVTDAGEQCDDGNSNNDDDCRNDCTLPRCGDGILDANEQCDDGNTVNGDGCDSECRIEPFCGDGIVQPELGETCEPPNTDTCDANCHNKEICNDFIDNDGDGLIDCLDPDCVCLPIGRDPGAIRFAANGGDDFLTVHGSFEPETPINPLTEIVGFLLTNSKGKVYEVQLPAGTLHQGGGYFRFHDANAQRNRDGLARVDIRFFPSRHRYTFVLKTYGNFAAATEASMTLQFEIGDDSFVNTSTWTRNSKGWVLKLPGEG